MVNSADPDQLASSDFYTVCKGRICPGSAEQRLIQVTLYLVLRESRMLQVLISAYASAQSKYIQCLLSVRRNFGSLPKQRLQ